MISNWNYYGQGVLKAYISFTDEEVIFSEKDFLTGKFKEYYNIEGAITDVGASKFNIPLKKIFELKEKFSAMEFTGENVIVDGFAKFTKGEEMYGRISDEDKIGIIWAQDDGLLDFITCDKKIICFIHTDGAGSEYLIKQGYEMLTPYSEWYQTDISEADKGVQLLGNFMVQMTDGTKLSTDVYLPTKRTEDETFPTIFIRTPYNKKRLAYRDSMYANRGYAVVLQDVRGRDESEGEFLAGVYEKTDGNDTLNWISEQSWSNKEVGTIGGSYSGAVQWAMAATGNEHLMAIVSQVTAGSPFKDIDRHNGGYSMGIMPWNIMMSKKETDIAMYSKNWSEELKHKPIKDIPFNITGKSLKLWDEYMAHPDYDEFWAEMSIDNHSDKIDIPALYFSGYHDGDICGTMEVWEMNKKNNRKNQRMIFGPWFHRFNGNRDVCGHKLGANAVIYNLDLMYLKWFDKFLKGIDNDVEKERLMYYIEGKNQWIKCENWEDNTKKLTFYLCDDNALNLLNQNEKNISTYRYDPNNATPHLSNEEGKTNVPLDYSIVEKREDIICFTTDEFDEDIDLVGNQEVELYASSDCKDTDWVVRLTRVDKSGASYRIVDEIIRAKYRNSFSNPEFLTHDKIEKYNFTLPYIGMTVRKGEKIRLQVASAKDGDMFPNSNTGKDPAIDTKTIIANQKIYFGGKTNSKVVLRILK